MKIFASAKYNAECFNLLHRGAWSFLIPLTVLSMGKVASFVSKIFVVRPLTTKTANILPHENYPLYIYGSQTYMQHSCKQTVPTIENLYLQLETSRALPSSCSIKKTTTYRCCCVYSRIT